jgi:hypothetical protein
MNKIKEEYDENYVLESKKNIDNYLNKNDYKRGFGLLILVLGKLDDNQKKDMINYYNKNFVKFFLLSNK